MNYMTEAILEADKGISQKHGGPFGCVIVKNGKIIGRGHNSVLLKHDPTCHGEIEAIRNACSNLNSHDLTDCELYTTAEPCPMCLGAILWSNIKTIYYGCNRQDTDEIGFRDDAFYEAFYGKKNLYTLEECERKECLSLFERYKKTNPDLY